MTNESVWYILWIMTIENVWYTLFVTNESVWYILFVTNENVPRNSAVWLCTRYTQHYEERNLFAVQSWPQVSASPATVLWHLWHVWPSRHWRLPQAGHVRQPPTLLSPWRPQVHATLLWHLWMWVEDDLCCVFNTWCFGFDTNVMKICVTVRVFCFGCEAGFRLSFECLLPLIYLFSLFLFFLWSIFLVFLVFFWFSGFSWPSVCLDICVVLCFVLFCFVFKENIVEPIKKWKAQARLFSSKWTLKNRNIHKRNARWDGKCFVHYVHFDFFSVP